MRLPEAPPAAKEQTARVSSLDAVIVGSGPNGLAAAVALAEQGLSVRVFEAHPQIGGGTRTAELTLPGFAHDVCSAVHPMGFLSSFLRRLPLAQHGLEWIHPPASVAHPLEDGSAVILERSLERTAQDLEEDAQSYAALLRPFVRAGLPLLDDLTDPLRWPRHPLAMARFGLHALRSAQGLAGRFGGSRARALLAGCAGHSILPLSRPLSGGVGLIFALTAHLTDWPVARGGSHAITLALARHLEALGGSIETAHEIRSLRELPPARAVLLDVAPAQLCSLGRDVLPASYRQRLDRYRYGPGVFKLDWALAGPIPWKDPRCGLASTVHVGGTLEEIAASEQAAFRGEICERPFVIATQQSHFDATRAPAGCHTGYAYCHVPTASTVDMTERIEAQIERFAPGFRGLVLARRAHAPLDFATYNPSFVGGAIAGGVADLGQFVTRPVARIDPYSTPNPRLFLCSAATPPGGGVHGLCGHHAARSVLARMRRGKI
jgi:phytoene dehydrogenase-like protein